MNRARSAILGGFVGTTVLSALLLLLEVQTRSAIPVFDVIARFVRLPGDPFVGFVVYGLAGVFVWPLLFVALEPYLPRGPDPAARAAVFATGLWAVFALTGRGGLDGPILVIYAAYTLFAHWAYGFTLGAVYAYFRETPDAATTGMTPQ